MDRKDRTQNQLLPGTIKNASQFLKKSSKFSIWQNKEFLLVLFKLQNSLKSCLSFSSPTLMPLFSSLKLPTYLSSPINLSPYVPYTILFRKILSMSQYMVKIAGWPMLHFAVCKPAGRVSKFKVHCYDEVVCPSCMYNSCNSTYSICKGSWRTY